MLTAIRDVIITSRRSWYCPFRGHSIITPSLGTKLGKCLKFSKSGPTKAWSSPRKLKIFPWTFVARMALWALLWRMEICCANGQSKFGAKKNGGNNKPSVTYIVLKWWSRSRALAFFQNPIPSARWFEKHKHYAKTLFI